MILLHTSDWHIGQSFYGYDRQFEHAVFFEWLLATIRAQQADVLLVAGDIFDSPNPSAESQRVYYRFLREATQRNPALQIVITAGNHDSAARLEAPNPLLEEMRVTVKGVVRRNNDDEIDYDNLLVPLYADGKVEAWCLAVPYLRQGDYPAAASYGEGVGKMYHELYAALVSSKKQPGQPVIAMGHLQAIGSDVSSNDRSERTVIGGLESISPDLFDKEDLLYTALGHLHKAQRVGGREAVRYSGSPLPMSFAEKNYKQGVNLVEIKGVSLQRMERLDFDPPVKLISLPREPRPLDEVLEEIAELPDGEVNALSPYLELKVLMTGPEPAMRQRIEEALSGKGVRLTNAVPYQQRGEQESKTITYEELRALSPMQMAEDVYRTRYGNEMPDTMKSLLQQVIEEAER